jgi:hypothetical protein
VPVLHFPFISMAYITSASADVKRIDRIAAQEMKGRARRDVALDSDYGPGQRQCLIVC